MCSKCFCPELFVLGMPYLLAYFLSRSSVVWKSNISPSARTSRGKQGKMRKDENLPLRFSIICILSSIKHLDLSARPHTYLAPQSSRLSLVFCSTPWKYLAAHRTSSARPQKMCSPGVFCWLYRRSIKAYWGFGFFFPLGHKHLLSQFSS